MTIYVVQPGDTLYTIARQHDVPVQRIVSDNGLHEPSRLTPGQVLVIQYPKQVYTVQQGDTLGNIASRFGMTVYELWQSRDILSADSLPVISIGFVVSFFSALIVVRWLLHYVARHDFSAFGWYRIFFGGVILVTWMTGLVKW